MLPRRGPGPGRDRPDAVPAHPVPGEPDRGRRAKAGEDLQRFAQRRFAVRPSRASPAS
jgi:hypothetical protein